MEEAKKVKGQSDRNQGHSLDREPSGVVSKSVPTFTSFLLPLGLEMLQNWHSFYKISE